MTAEHKRLDESRTRTAHWKRWGPYLSERAWGTVREDYSADGTAWEYFPHDHARSRAYRWNEDGIAGICDRHQKICFALALWNGRDPILKERLFGLTGNEGNHGEDVKEYYFYLDSTPTHSYMKYLYKYPQADVPVRAARRGESRGAARATGVRTARHGRLRRQPLLRRASSSTPRPVAEDILIRITVANRGPEARELHLLPTVWFRNTWSWGKHGDAAARCAVRHRRCARRSCDEPEYGTPLVRLRAPAELLFTENETNSRAAVRVAERRRRTSRTGSTTTSSTATRERRESRAARHEGRGALPARRSRPGELATACGCG